MYTNSSLVNYKKISPYCTSPRNNTIKKITIHHMAGNLSVETCGNVFQSSQSSANYGIGTDGRIGLYVEEKDRSWASSSPSNDHQAVTIEVANDGGATANWHVSDKALESLINLCVDICKRNNIEKLNFTGNANGNLTMHSYFAATTCPGPYLKSKFQWIAEEVNKRLGKSEVVENTVEEVKKSLYRIRKSWDDSKSQVGAYTNLDSAKTMCDKAGSEYSVFDSNGNVVYPIKVTTTTTTVAKSVYRIRKSWNDSKSQVGAFNDINRAKKACDQAGSGYYVFDESGNAIYPIVVTPATLNVGDVIKLESGAKYTNGKSIPNWVINSTLYVREIQGDNIVFSTVKTGAITGVVHNGYIVGSEAEPKKSVTEIAKEVIKGLWGNGADRINKLKAAGYNPDEVQAEVNKLL